MRSLNIGLYSSENTSYPECIHEYIFEMRSFDSFEEYDSDITTQAIEFKCSLSMRVLGAIRLNIYIPDNSGTILVKLLSVLYCTPFLEINIYHYDKDSNIWISQNFQFVQEIDWDTMVSKPHTVNDAYY